MRWQHGALHGGALEDALDLAADAADAEGLPAFGGAPARHRQQRAPLGLQGEGGRG